MSILTPFLFYALNQDSQDERIGWLKFCYRPYDSMMNIYYGIRL